MGEKVSFWRRLFGGAPPRVTEPRGFLELWQRFGQGISPTPVELAELAQLELDTLTGLWTEAIAHWEPDEGESAWRLARVLGLEDRWREALGGIHAQSKESLVEQLGAVSAPGVIDLLKIAVDDKAHAVGLSAAIKLAMRPEPGMTDFFLGLLARPEGGAWTDRGARGLLTRRISRPGEVWTGLLKGIRDTRSFLRARAWEVIANLGPLREGEIDSELIRGGIEGGLGDKDATVRAKVMEAVGSLALKDPQPFLLKGLGDRESAVRGQAARAAGRLAALGMLQEGGESIKAALTDMLQDEDWKSSAWAKEALRYFE